jgi:hypothetical protein
MQKISTVLLLLIVSVCCVNAQKPGFPFGAITFKDMTMSTYDKDTSAIALVLDEFGEAHIESFGEFNLVFTHHQRIKILKQAGARYADVEILVRKTERHTELIRSITASSFNIVDGRITETKFDIKNKYVEDGGKFYDLIKFAIPNARVGSIIEFEYELESPYITNFREWEFQSEIPKLRSEYWALIPGNYQYNIALRGFLGLTKNENAIERGCYSPTNDMKADCLSLKYAIENIPAFVAEDYMTARSNFISAVNFELKEIKHFDGRIDRVTQEWKDAEDELRRNQKFGIQIKRGKDVIDRHIEELITGEADLLARAKKIYDFIKFRYRWDEVYGKYSEFGIKKAFDSKVGNVGDINLSLIAALRYGGISTDPLLLSTRLNGSVTELYPVISEFNYVIAKATIDGEDYLLDATDDFLPFGLIPERCLNGKGRVLGDKESYWYELKAPDREKQVCLQTLKLHDNGTISGKIQNSYIGYEAMEQRKLLASCANQKEYIGRITRGWDGLEVSEFKISNIDALEQPLQLEMEISFDAGAGGATTFLFNPFLGERWQVNPFKSAERLYPVDFGAPLEEIQILKLELPAGVEVEELPERVGLQLPAGGGRYLFTIQKQGNSLAMNSSLLIAKTVFTATEYHYLKELFARVVSIQQTDLVLRKKT